MIQIDHNGRNVQGYLAKPASGAGPGVLVLHAWWGLTDVFKEVCDRLAGEGFIALAPDLFRGRTAATRAEAQALVESIDDEATFEDLATATDYLLEMPGRTGEKIGTVGFSLGAAYALFLSWELRQAEVGAVVVYYGLGGGDFTLAQASYLGHFAENDEFESVDLMRKLESDMRAMGREVNFIVYPGTQHWFFEPNQEGYYHPEAAKLSWQATLEFLREKIF